MTARWGWLDEIQPGDVVRFKSGALRTAIAVSRAPFDFQNKGHRRPIRKGTVTAVAFPILHCSWTKRGYTILSRTDLMQRAECLTRARINLPRYPVAQRVILDCALKRPQRVEGASCCDVIGVFA